MMDDDMDLFFFLCLWHRWMSAVCLQLLCCPLVVVKSVPKQAAKILALQLQHVIEVVVVQQHISTW